jgi:hypothetical protein
MRCDVLLNARRKEPPMLFDPIAIQMATQSTHRKITDARPPRRR